MEDNAAHSFSDSPNDMEGTSVARPFLKWAGGKYQLLPELKKRLPSHYENYYEPFLGGGAFFFSTAPKRGFLFDINEELVNVYLVIQNQLEALIGELTRHRYDRSHFYEVREWDRLENYSSRSSVERAGRFIFLNKCCFNGLYRVNSKGKFNVPFGSYKDPKFFQESNLRACSLLLQTAQIRCESYLQVGQEAKEGDFAYFDPPYAPLSTTSNFTTYSKEGFGEADQICLRDLCTNLHQKGVKFLLSNSSAPLILDLYKDFQIEYVDASRSINSKGEGRGKIQELLIRNYS